MIDKINKPTEYNAYQFSEAFTRKFNEQTKHIIIKDCFRMKVGKQYKFSFCIKYKERFFEVNITKRTLPELEAAILNFLQL